MNTHNLCFGLKIRKIVIPLYTPVLLYKYRIYGGIHFTDMFSRLMSCKFADFLKSACIEIRR